MNTINIEIGLGRDAFDTLTKSGLLSRMATKKVRVPQPQVVLLPTSDEIDGKALMAKLAELQAFAGELVEMLAESVGEGEAMKADMEDMVGKEDMAAAIEEKQKELDAMKAAMAEAEKTADALKADRDALAVEVEPLRAKEITDLRSEVVLFGLTEDQVTATTDAPSLRRLAVAAKLGARYTETVGTGDTLTFKVSDDIVKGAYEGASLSIKQQVVDAAAAEAKAKADRDANSPFARVPALVPAPPVAAGRDGADQGAGANNQNANQAHPPQSSFRDGIAATGG